MLDYYDRQGRPITMEQWAELREDHLHVAETWVGQLWVSTVWLGMDHGWGDGPPLIFETMVFARRVSYSEFLCFRYSTEAAALVGHQRAVLVAERHKYGWVKHARDERRAERKRLLRLVDRQARGEELDEFEVMGLRLARMR